MHTRYSRQILFPAIGREGQEKLLTSHVTIVGMGALGTVLANHMVRAGVGKIRLIDRDFVEESNLQRQMLYDENDAKNHMPKVMAATEKLRSVNSGVEIEPELADVHAANAEKLLTGTDLILDATDNFQIRFLINDVAVKHHIPWIYGGAVSSKGMFAVIRPYETPCFRCLFNQPPEGRQETCDTVGVIGPLVHIVASYQATEALKLLVGDTEHLNPNLEHLEIWQNVHSGMNIQNARNPECPACGKQHFEFLNPATEEEQFTTLCGRDTIQITPAKERRFNLDEMEKQFSSLGRVERNKFLLRLHVDSYVLIFFPDGRVLIQGTDDMSVARSLYARYVGM
ncbi:MAG: ThiF family adenylyltransferase [Bacillaceae bacterium]|nr:ThiF family adenylyltransferase [Bacillaceae bacterium]